VRTRWSLVESRCSAASSASRKSSAGADRALRGGSSAASSSMASAAAICALLRSISTIAALRPPGEHSETPTASDVSGAAGAVASAVMMCLADDLEPARCSWTGLLAMSPDSAALAVVAVVVELQTLTFVKPPGKIYAQISTSDRTHARTARDPTVTVNIVRQSRHSILPTFTRTRFTGTKLTQTHCCPKLPSASKAASTSSSFSCSTALLLYSGRMTSW
jgi:hypothetical protein